ncbi:MAG TPA: elongation factor G [Geobacteraceae bacterium]|nr:elongation factor G [Geobacteraceae bacterium]
MTHPPLNAIRNIGIISHIDAGKTTVSERILFYTGEIHKTGEVHEGLATMDWMEQEQERGITITATATTCRWRSWWLNLIDTPGHIDFTIEVERSLRVLDGAVAIFSAVEGVQPQSESVWRQSDRYRVPRICLINKMDRIGADYRAVVAQMSEILHARPLLIQLPMGIEGEFHGVIDLLTCKLLTFDETDQGLTVAVNPVPAGLAEEVRTAREKVVEAAADFDDAILADFLQGADISAERLQSAIRRGTLECRLFPVLLGAALRNRGIQPLLDAIGAYLPSPLETTPIRALHPDNESLEPVIPDPGGHLCAMAFKVQSDEGRKLTYLRLYAGTLRAGDEVWNSTRRCRERIPRLFRMHAHRRESLDEARAGDIVAAAGLREALTGDTLCDPDHHRLLSGLTIPEPVVSLAVEPRGAVDREKLLPALEKLQWEDPTFRVREDTETGQLILSGMGELHLEIIIDRLAREFDVRVKTGRPQVVYRETLTRAVVRREFFRCELEGKFQTCEIMLSLTPLSRGKGLHVNLPHDTDNTLPPELWDTLAEDLKQVCTSGPLAGFPLIDLEVRVSLSLLQPGETTDLGLSAAAQRGVAIAAREGKPTLLEPIMALELLVPSEFAGRVIGTLQQKHGRVEGMQMRADMEVIRARAPLSEMFGYMTDLRSATKGRGTFTMEFSHFDLAPAEVQQRFGVGIESGRSN